MEKTRENQLFFIWFSMVLLDLCFGIECETGFMLQFQGLGMSMRLKNLRQLERGKNLKRMEVFRNSWTAWPAAHTELCLNEIRK